MGSVLRASVMFGEVLPHASKMATLSWKVILEPKDGRFTVSWLDIRESIEKLRKNMPQVVPDDRDTRCTT